MTDDTLAAGDTGARTTNYSQILVGGTWVDPHSDQTLTVTSPATGEVVGSTPIADAADVDAAVAAARRSFDDGIWRNTPPAERAEFLDRLNALVTERSDQICALLGAEMGAPAGVAATLQHLPATGTISAYADITRNYQFTEYRSGLMGHTQVTREPVGVVGAIIAWNVPLFLLANKLAPSLAAGCSVVLKPAPETPLSANLFAELCYEAGLPEGVLSVVPGAGETGQALVEHPAVDKITFTGSTAVGRRIAASCGEQLKRCSLELGGKSAAIVLEDANIAESAAMLAFSGLMNTGQACVAQTRILVPRNNRDEIVAALIDAVAAMPVGLPDDPEAQLGPLITEAQRDKVEGYIAAGVKAGATVALEGGRPAHLDSGFYLTPTIFTDVTNDMVIAQEEIFGPVLSVIDYDTEKQAIAIAKDSDYGLAGSVWTTDVEHGLEVAAQIRTGTYGINWYAFDPGSPFGGFKNSGIGRENGPEGLEAYLEFKSTILPMGYAPPA